MRQLAWLHAVPEGSKKSRLTAFKETAGDDSTFLEFPDLEEAAYLVGLIHEAGLSMHTGMGAIPLTWQEIESWLRLTGLDLSVWEILTIRDMSEAYVIESSVATKKHAVAPYSAPVPELSKEDRAAIASKLGSVLRGFKRKQPPVGEP